MSTAGHGLWASKVMEGRGSETHISAAVVVVAAVLAAGALLSLLSSEAARRARRISRVWLVVGVLTALGAGPERVVPSAAAGLEVREALVYVKDFATPRAAIWIAEIDGSRPRRLVAGDRRSSPDLSPDGRLVAFLRGCEDRCDLYVVSSSGGSSRLLARGARPLAWSSDSRHFAADVSGTLVVFDAETGDGVTIDAGAKLIFGASFSPSGDEIIWAPFKGEEYLSQGGVDLFRAPATGGRVERLTEGGGSLNPVWGPELVAFSRFEPPVPYAHPVYEVWVMRPDGSAARRLVASNLVPVAWSHDGERLLAGAASEFDLAPVAVDVATGTARDLVAGQRTFEVMTDALSGDGRFVLVHRAARSTSWDVIQISWSGGRGRVIARDAWSPDWNWEGAASGESGEATGEAPLAANGRIAFVESGIETGDTRIVTVSSDGTDEEVVLLHGASGLAWSPEGTRLALSFSTTESMLEVRVVNADGSGEQTIARGWSPAWSPDGRMIAFASEDGIEVVSAEGGAPTLLVPNGLDPAWSRLNPAWSVDGRIAFRRCTAGIICSIYVLDSLSDREPRELRSGDISGLDWSPDGGQIVFTTGSGEGCLDPAGVWVMDADGTNVRQIVGPDPSGAERCASEPTWSPDGGQIAFVLYEKAIYLVDADGSDLRPLIRDAGECCFRSDPDWQPVPVAGLPMESAPAPELARSVVVTPLQGMVLVRLEGETDFTVLTEPRHIPLGSEVDAREGRVELTSVRDASGTLQTGVFFDGLFRVLQPEAPDTVTELHLEGGDFAGCAEAAPETSIRRLWGDAEGMFRTRGRYSSTTIRGTVWLTEDRCAGTRTFVQEGNVMVEDLERGQVTVLQAGQDYLAAPAARSRLWLIVGLAGGGLLGISFLGTAGVLWRRRRVVVADASPRGFCTRCGAPLRPESRFCGACGAHALPRKSGPDRMSGQ